MAIDSFKQALHRAVATAEYNDDVAIGEVKHMDVGSNLNPLVILYSLVKIPVDYVIEEGSGERTSLLNAAVDLTGH